MTLLLYRIDKILAINAKIKLMLTIRHNLVKSKQDLIYILFFIFSQRIPGKSSR